MPPGGDGFYYLSAFLTVDGAEYALMDVELNGELICSVYSDLQTSSPSDSDQASCSALKYVVEGINLLDFFLNRAELSEL